MGADVSRMTEDVIKGKFRLNPGPYEDLSKKYKDLFPKPIDGVTVVLSHSMNDNLELSHAFSMDTGYRAWSTYTSPNDKNPDLVIFSGMDPSGTLHTRGSYRWNDYFLTKIDVQLRKSRYDRDRSEIQYGMDIRGKDFTSSITFIDMNLLTLKGAGIFNYLQTITPKVCVGMEITHQNQPRTASTSLSVAGRYTADKSIWTASGSSTKVIGMTFYHQLNQEMQVGFEAEKNYRLSRPLQLLIAAALNVDLNKVDLSLKVKIDNNWTVTGVLEKRFLGLATPLVLAVGGSGNQIKKEFQLGCCVTVEA